MNHPPRSLAGSGVLSAIGRTALVRLDRLLPGERGLRVHAKLEGLNPGGSIKDRSALQILRDGIESGLITPETTIIESTSGNMGVGLAQLCRYYGLSLVCVVDRNITPINQRILTTFGARLLRVEEPDPESGDLLQARLKRVQQFLRDNPGTFWPNQYANLSNAIAHHQTMHEIVTELNGDVDLLLCATSTCGTILGCSQYVAKHSLKTRIWAVDAVGSVIFGGPRMPRKVPGHGAGIRPELARNLQVDRVLRVSDGDCVAGCHTLLQREAILAGGSSGAVVQALVRAHGDIPRGSTVVLILPDRGERYLQTIYDPAWVEEHISARLVAGQTGEPG